MKETLRNDIKRILGLLKKDENYLFRKRHWLKKGKLGKVNDVIKIQRKIDKKELKIDKKHSDIPIVQQVETIIKHRNSLIHSQFVKVSNGNPNLMEDFKTEEILIKKIKKIEKILLGKISPAKKHGGKFVVVAVIILVSVVLFNIFGQDVSNPFAGDKEYSLNELVVEYGKARERWKKAFDEKGYEAGSVYDYSDILPKDSEKRMEFNGYIKMLENVESGIKFYEFEGKEDSIKHFLDEIVELEKAGIKYSLPKETKSLIKEYKSKIKHEYYGNIEAEDVLRSIRTIPPVGYSKKSPDEPDIHAWTNHLTELKNNLKNVKYSDDPKIRAAEENYVNDVDNFLNFIEDVKDGKIPIEDVKDLWDKYFSEATNPYELHGVLTVEYENHILRGKKVHHMLMGNIEISRSDILRKRFKNSNGFDVFDSKMYGMEAKRLEEEWVKVSKDVSKMPQFDNEEELKEWAKK